MKKKKPLKIYTLYRSLGRWTNQSSAYGRHGYRSLVNVAAYSIKQAYYLAHRNSWGSVGEPGIYEMTHEDKTYKSPSSEGEFCGLDWSHGQRVKKPSET